MREFFRRFFHQPLLAAEILAASFFLNLLFLASPIFVIQILSRYIPYGFDATLVTLTTGMLIALVLLFAFQIIRNRLSTAVSLKPDRALSSQAMAVLTRAKNQALRRIPPAQINELMNGPQTVQAAYAAPHVNAVVDFPFFLIFLLAVLILSPLLAAITLLAVGCTVLAGWMSMKRARAREGEMREEYTAHRGLSASVLSGAETVRAFQGTGFVRRIWEKQVERLSALRRRAGDEKSVSQAVIQAVGGVLRVAIYAVGARQVIVGQLTVGALIGASILSAKTVQIASSFMQASLAMGKAQDVLSRLAEFFALPREPESGAALKKYSGNLEIKDVGFAYPGNSGPLFESLNLRLEPGQVLLVDGFNGSGKTTLAKLLVGLLEPGRGQVLGDGVDIRQFAPEWWRSQIMYLPQEPSFLNASMRENITLAAPDMDPARLNQVVRLAGLRRYLDTTPRGLETPVADGGRNLPLGIKRRLALARALAVGGRLAVFDEPTEGLDAEGCDAVYQVFAALLRQKATVVVMSRDEVFARAATYRLDLSEKPVPALTAGPRHQAKAPDASPDLGEGSGETE